MLCRAAAVAAVTTLSFTSYCDGPADGNHVHQRPEDASVSGKVGDTPLIYIRSLSELTGCHIYGKAEFMNPTGSVKDRVALTILQEAERDGRLKPGGTILEGTGGNTGIALAQFGAARGYKVKLYLPNCIAQEKIDYARRFDTCKNDE